jgi:hypothetical protein
LGYHGRDDDREEEEEEEDGDIIVQLWPMRWRGGEVMQRVICEVRSDLDVEDE